MTWPVVLCLVCIAAISGVGLGLLRCVFDLGARLRRLDKRVTDLGENTLAALSHLENDVYENVVWKPRGDKK